MLTFSIREHEGIKLLELSGSINVNTVDNLKIISERIIQNESLIISLEAVDLITSTGINSLAEISINAKKTGSRVILLWPDEELIRMAESLDLIDYLIFASSIEEALTKIRFFSSKK
jgi:anti-anti-sigma factor